MRLIKLLHKLLAVPIIVAVTLIQWVGIFLTQFSAVIFNPLAGLLFLIAIAGWMFGIGTGTETLQMLLGQQSSHAGTGRSSEDA